MHCVQVGFRAAVKPEFREPLEPLFRNLARQCTLAPDATEPGLLSNKAWPRLDYLYSAALAFSCPGEDRPQ
jgi:hypothetical protein